MSYWLPWQLQSMVPLATCATGQPMCVQMELKALNSPAFGWVTTVLVAAMIVPPPTGMSALAMPASPPEPPACRRRALRLLAELAGVGCSCRSRRRRRRARSRRGPRPPPLPHRGSRYGGRGVLRSRPGPHQAWLVLRGPDGVGSPLLKGERPSRTCGSPRRGPLRGCGGAARAAGDCARVGRSGGPGAGARSRGMDPQAYDAFTAALRESLARRPTSWGWSRSGPWPAGTTSRTSSPTTTSSSSSSPPSAEPMRQDLSWLPGPTPCCCPSARRRTA